MIAFLNNGVAWMDVMILGETHEFTWHCIHIQNGHAIAFWDNSSAIGMVDNGSTIDNTTVYSEEHIKPTELHMFFLINGAIETLIHHCVTLTFSCGTEASDGVLHHLATHGSTLPLPAVGIQHTPVPRKQLVETIGGGKEGGRERREGGGRGRRREGEVRRRREEEGSKGEGRRRGRDEKEKGGRKKYER